MSGADINSEQRELCLLQLDALASLVVILLVELKADEVALLFYTSNGGGAAAHSVVQYGVSLVGLGTDEVLDESDSFFGGVEAVVNIPLK